MPSDSYSAEYWHLVPCVFKQETEIPMWPAVWFCVITSFSGFTPFQRPSVIQCKPFPPLKVTYKYSPFPPDKSHSNWICFLWNNCLNGFSPCLLKKDRAEAMEVFWSKGITQCLRSWDLSGSALVEFIPDKVWESSFMSGQILTPHSCYSVSQGDGTVTLIQIIHLHISE